MIFKPVFPWPSKVSTIYLGTWLRSNILEIGPVFTDKMQGVTAVLMLQSQLLQNNTTVTVLSQTAILPRKPCITLAKKKTCTVRVICND